MKKFYFLVLLIFIFKFDYAQTTLALVADKDNTIYSATPDNSNGSGQWFFVGKNSPFNNGSVQRALLHFNLSQIPAGAVVTAATLTIYVSKSAPAATGIELHALSSDWGEGTSDAAGNEASGVSATTNDATWNQKIFPSAQWTAPGGDFLSKSSASVPSISAGLASPTAIALTGQNIITDVQGWLTNPSSNFGWLIKSDNENAGATVKRFVSRNSAVTAQRPSLTITYTATSLPVTLKGFSASLNNHDALLKWITSNEEDNEHYEVQHSLNGRDFTSIGTIQGNGTTTSEHFYTFVDKNISAGKHFYRLVGNDKNGSKHYSKVILLSTGKALQLEIYPNPTASFISTAASSMLQGNAYTIISNLGQSLIKGKITDQQIDVRKLAAGQYWLLIHTDAGEVLKSVFIKK